MTNCHCGAVAVHSGIVDGLFGKYCTKHFDIRRPESAQHAQYKRDRDREHHEEDVIQPWKDGKPNAEFLEQYEEYAKETFTPEQIEKLDRDY